jgi:phosphorylcholine metabolism protein LicD
MSEEKEENNLYRPQINDMIDMMSQLNDKLQGKEAKEDDDRVDWDNLDLSRIPVEVRGWNGEDDVILFNPNEERKKKIEEEEQHKKFYKTSITYSGDYPKPIPDLHLYYLNKLLFDIIEILNEKHIPYFVDGGTLLGAIRHQGHIPWCDNNCISMLGTNYKRFTKCIDLIKEKYPYHIVQYKFHTKIFLPDHWVVSEEELKGEKYTRTVSTPTLDIYAYKQEGDELVLKNKDLKKLYPNSIYTREILFPLTKYTYDRGVVIGAKNPSDYLDKMYPHWQTEFIEYHRDEKNPLLREIL